MRSLSILLAAGLFAAVFAGQASAQVAPADPNVEVLARGPIHEAFAAPVATGAVEPLVVPKQPPEPIDELPPDARPEDASAVWISGYWAWDDERQDFLWVSGVWRVAPPGQQWVSGYWVDTGGGWRWVPGFWSPVDVQEVEYLPEPPQTVEQGPTSDPPSAGHFWVPGSWVWHQARFAWQPGYWSLAQPGWVWIPAAYYWSPAGYVYWAGYWDWTLPRRGLCFSPVYFSRPVYRLPNWYYSPSVVVNTSALTLHLFARPSYHHYYFGDFYAPTYARYGIVPWFSVHEHRRSYAYDPLFTYHQWYHRSRDPGWERDLRAQYRRYVETPDIRPPRDYRTVAELRARGGLERKEVLLAESLSDFRRRNDAPIRITEINNDQRQNLRIVNKQINQFRDERQRLERQARLSDVAGAVGAGGAAQAGRTKPDRLRLPQTPAALQARGDATPTPRAGAADKEATAATRPPERPDRRRGPRTNETAAEPPGGLVHPPVTQPGAVGITKPDAADPARRSRPSLTTPGGVESAQPGLTESGPSKPQRRDPLRRDRSDSASTVTPPMTPGVGGVPGTPPVQPPSSTGPITGGPASSLPPAVDRARRGGDPPPTANDPGLAPPRLGLGRPDEPRLRPQGGATTTAPLTRPGRPNDAQTSPAMPRLGTGAPPSLSPTTPGAPPIGLPGANPVNPADPAIDRSGRMPPPTTRIERGFETPRNRPFDVTPRGATGPTATPLATPPSGPTSRTTLRPPETGPAAGGTGLPRFGRPPADASPDRNIPSAGIPGAGNLQPRASGRPSRIETPPSLPAGRGGNQAAGGDRNENRRGSGRDRDR